MRFSYYKIANRIVPCDVVQYYLRYGVVMLFCWRFWYSFCGLCGLCGLVNILIDNETSLGWIFM